MSEPVTTDDVALQTFKERGPTAAQFRFGKFYILMTCNRITDKKTVERYIKDYGIERPAANHEIKSFGFRITVNDEKAELFRYSKKPIETGREQWAFSLRRSSLQPTAVYGITLQIYEADPVNRIDFNTQTSIDAALAVYRSTVQQAEYALRQELLRIAQVSSTEYRNPTYNNEPTPNPNKPNNSELAKTSTVSKEAGKRLVTFKKSRV